MVMKSYEGYSIRAVKKRYLGSPTNDGRLFLFVPPIMLAETVDIFRDLRSEIQKILLIFIIIISSALIDETSLNF